MKSGSLGYLTKEGFRNLKVNKLMTLASVTVLFSCMFLMGAAFMLFVNIDALVSDIESENVIMVYIEDEADSVEVVDLKTQILSIPNVESCEFIGKDEAYEDILEGMSEDVSAYLRDLEENPLPDAYRVTVSDMSQFQNTVSRISGFDGILRIRENSELASKLSTAKQSVTYISMAIICLLLLVSLFIISNTIKITMFSRRLEISIMKSVGATNRFIRWPFMIEGMLIGAISGIISLFAVWGVYELACKYLRTVGSMFTDSAVDFVIYLPYMLGAFVVLGIFTGIFGSANSIRKYLKERKFVEIDELG